VVLPDHSESEQRRELLLRSLGGTSRGCFAVQHAWQERRWGRPGPFSELRQDFWNRVRYGDTAGVLELIDAGYPADDPDEHGYTVLDLLAWDDPQLLLPRLASAGPGAAVPPGQLRR